MSLPQDDPFLAKGDFVYRDTPLEIRSAEAATLTDREGRRWIDLEAANGAALLGYDPQLVRETVADWAALPTAPSFAETQHRRAFADALGRRVLASIGRPGRLAFDLGGAQGIELALRMAALAQPSRRTILVLDGAYHGRSLFLSNLSASFRYRAALAPTGYRIVRLPSPGILTAQAGLAPEDALRFCRMQARRAFLDESGGQSAGGASDCLALLFEPLLNVAGMVDPGPSFLSELLGLAREAGCASIADEVFTGYHRTGPFLACETLDGAPDMIVLSKAITNGLAPLSAVWAQPPYGARETFPPGAYSTTFGNNPLHFIIARRVLDRVSALSQGDIKRVTAFLEEMAAALLRRAPGAHASGVLGMTAYVEFATSEARDKTVARLGATSPAARLLFARTGASKLRLLMHPPVTIRDEEMAAALDAVANLQGGSRVAAE
ncbi:MAG: aminotransferase class III-fold pyridoxal phosphate-dependent enzyme [Phenylobacterium sp.]|jgi:4-aminobutyrate aminotransferase-like enzyme|uniref:aminotransferase class III-fold pyridoxal phosphate-dependent enzyme n=1 Tax=Phenylobacterium sp. TaxID=1871053 RepID=UPI00217A2F82|nr:aminotransferase class III-fold pyridoxal phosphate-dependent enzyme [Phenylobacterium sp.]MCA3260088.1 aminotransferase class III-fold pyridoxal phosphate-dependent enzyme [Rubrivivax sp.]MCA3757879.1 aminotransferase class III-fold pyridoxal phosphate-dependent enzyme [Phenylobacterium sp.]